MDPQEALLAKQEAAIALSQQAFSAIGNVQGTANFYLAVISAVIGTIGIVGGAAVFFLSQRAAKRLAEERIKSYLAGDEVRVDIQRAVSDEVQRQLKERVLVMVSPDMSPAGAPAPFSPPPQGRQS